MRSELAKVLHRAGGRPLIEHVVRACQPLKPAQLLAIVGHQAEAVGEVVAPWARRPFCNSRSAAPATPCRSRAARFAKARSSPWLLPGDAPLLRTETLAALLDTHRRGEAAATILTAEIDDPTDYGRIVRDTEGRVAAIVEEKSATPEQRAIREVNSSIYCFTLAKLWPCLTALRPENAHRELYLTDAIALLRAAQRTRAGANRADPQRNSRVQHARAPCGRSTAFSARAKRRN